MPRAKRFHLAQKLAIVALGAAALAIGTGQLPALAYGGPPPPPAPGGYTAVVTSQTIGPDGGVIGPVRVDVCSVALTVPRGTFKSQVQITITAPTVQDIGDGGQPGYRAVCGVGVLIQVDGQPYTGGFGHELILDISGINITHNARVVVWNGTEFVQSPRPLRVPRCGSHSADPMRTSRCSAAGGAAASPGPRGQRWPRPPAATAWPEARFSPAYSSLPAGPVTGRDRCARA